MSKADEQLLFDFLQLNGPTAHNVSRNKKPEQFAAELNQEPKNKDESTKARSSSSQ